MAKKFDINQLHWNFFILCRRLHMLGANYSRKHSSRARTFSVFQQQLIWKFFFCFSFVFSICSSKIKTHHVTRDLFTEKVISRWHDFNSPQPGGLKVVERVQEYKHTEQVSNYKDSEQRVFSYRMIKIVRVENVPARQHLFREQVARNMLRSHF